jgi:hypothetical protein
MTHETTHETTCWVKLIGSPGPSDTLSCARTAPGIVWTITKRLGSSGTEAEDMQQRIMSLCCYYFFAHVHDHACLSIIPLRRLVCFTLLHDTDLHELREFIVLLDQLKCNGSQWQYHGPNSPMKGGELDFQSLSPLSRFMSTSACQHVEACGNVPADFGEITTHLRSSHYIQANSGTDEHMRKNANALFKQIRVNNARQSGSV